jgi:hypothetical protein
MQPLSYYQSLANQMVQRDVEKNQMQLAMDKMWRGEWQLPQQLTNLKWMHKVVSTDPHDAVRAGTRVLSTIFPNVKVQPLGEGEKNREISENIEQILSWHFNQANSRGQTSILRDIVRSALLYDEVIAQVVYLPHQLAAQKKIHPEKIATNFSKQKGAFAIIIRNPQQIHINQSDWGTEAILHKQVLPIHQVEAIWGENADPLKSFPNHEKLSYVTIYDYMDLENRVVWAIPQNSANTLSSPIENSKSASSAIEILRQPHQLGFLPWVVKIGGTSLEQQNSHQRIPLLYSIYQTQQWETQNILETLLTSEMIAYAAAPRLKIEGPTDMVDIAYGEPGRMAHVPPGHNLSPLPPPLMDESLASLAERVAKRISKSTVPSLLQNGEIPAGTPFATLNLATQTGLKSLSPYQQLAEQTLSQIYTHMLYWVHQSKKSIIGYSQNREADGKPVILKASDIDIENIYIDVKLTPDIPTDRMVRINAAAMAVKDLGYSKERALEQIGEVDARFVLQQARNEKLEEGKLNWEIQNLLEENKEIKIEKHNKHANGKYLTPEVKTGEPKGNIPT